MNTEQETVSVLVQSVTGTTLITAPIEASSTAGLIIFAITFLALFLAGVCICRMNALSPQLHKLQVRLRYLFMFGGSVCLAGAPWFWPEYHHLGTLIFLLAVIINVLLSTSEWRHGAPESASHAEDPRQQDLAYPPEPFLSHLWLFLRYYSQRANNLFRGD